MMGRTPFVWVRKDFVPAERPGLILEWRHDQDGWRALVAFIEPTPQKVVVEWLRPSNLRPVPPDGPRMGSAYG